MKNFKHWAIQKLLKWSKILDIEKALRDKYHEGVEATEKKYAGRTYVWIDPTVRSQQDLLKSAVYEPPEKHTDPVVIPAPRGRYFLEHRPKLQPVIRANTEPIDLATDFPEWLVGVNDPTAKVPAIRKQAYQEYHKRHAG